MLQHQFLKKCHSMPGTSVTVFQLCFLFSQNTFAVDTSQWVQPGITLSKMKFKKNELTWFCKKWFTLKNRFCSALQVSLGREEGLEALPRLQRALSQAAPCLISTALLSICVPHCGWRLWAGVLSGQLWKDSSQPQPRQQSAVASTVLFFLSKANLHP